MTDHWTAYRAREYPQRPRDAVASDIVQAIKAQLYTLKVDSEKMKRLVAAVERELSKEGAGDGHAT
jgi:hypothetical protein